MVGTMSVLTVAIFGSGVSGVAVLRVSCIRRLLYMYWLTAMFGVVAVPGAMAAVRSL
jgi:hypothetical protein